MALWLQLQKLDSRYLDQVDQLYDDAFPMEIRQYLSQWIESQDWDAIALDDSLARVRFSDLLSKLNEQHGCINMGDSFLLQHNIRKITRNLQNRFQEYPTHMAMIISKSLNEERKILASAVTTQGNAGSSQSHGMMEKQKQLDNQVNELNKRVQDTEQEIPILEDQQDEHDFRKKTVQSKMEVEVSAQAAKEIQLEELGIKNMCITLNKMREAVVSKLISALHLAEQIQVTLISEEVPEWKQRQQMACIGGPPNACLDQLQNWFTSVAKCLQQIRQQLSTLQELLLKFNVDNDPITLDLSSVQENAGSLFKNLLLNAIVVERQPCMPTYPQRPLVLKTTMKFTVKLRLLVKLQELNYKLKVKASIDKDVNEKNAPKGFRRFNLLGTTTKVMNMEESNGCLAAEFQHLQLKEMKPVGTKAVEPSLLIMEELHSISFETELSQPGLSMNITTTSLPVVVISHGNQMPSAWASILWFNMLCKDFQNLQFFRSPPPMPWGELAKVLSWQFSSITKRGLNADQLSMLADKLLGPEAHGNPEELVYWNKFSRPVANERGGAFWLWIEGILDLIKRCLLNIWNDGYIIGFINKEREKNLLQYKRPGTFLLRFSETCKDGGITITWVEHSSCGEAEIHSVKPYTKSDLLTLSFADIIRDYTLMAAQNIPENPLIYLYPDIPKDEAFGRYYSSTPDASEEMDVDRFVDPYVGRHMIPVSVVPETRLQDNILPLSPEDFGMIQDFNKNNGMEELFDSLPY